MCESDLYAGPLVCPFFRIPWLLHQSPPPPPTLMYEVCVFVLSTNLLCYLYIPFLCLHLIRFFTRRLRFVMPSPALPPFALLFTFICLDRFHLGGNNLRAASFIQMTSSNPFFAVGCINPAHSLAPTEFITEAQIQLVSREQRVAATTEEPPGGIE